MKKLFKFILWLVLAIVAIAAIGAAYIAIDGIPTYTAQKIDIKVEVTPERIAHGLKLAQNLCIKCHLNPNTNKLTGKEIVDLPAEFGFAYSANITQDKEHGIGNWTDGELIYLFRTGVKPNGQYLPPWMPKFAHMSDEDLFSIVSFLHSGESVVQASTEIAQKSDPSFLAKFLSHVAFKPLPYPDHAIAAPDTTNLVAYGKYCVAGRYECYSCHSRDFKTMNIMEPEKSEGYCGGGNPLLNMSRQTVHSANITPDEETGIGKWTLEQFTDLLRNGKRPNGKTINYPMEPYSNLDDIEIKSIYAYLRTIPPLHNEVARFAGN